MQTTTKNTLMVIISSLVFVLGFFFLHESDYALGALLVIHISFSMIVLYGDGLVSRTRDNDGWEGYSEVYQSHGNQFKSKVGSESHD
ncbi:hypothetical protein ACP43V_07840 [Vibrio genomosp. F10 str. 9ZC157]|uniref:Uncharacterized protein n=1 Tax=Vibrio genomosp. F10 str. ZF-129 TaxID=1187848 RepID=A0A1E5BK06_9VIBR|nr:hypothetical protein [Vibrio genomosp. F10]OEE38122.1 hypothetical protein A1QO_16375 [Vibrio genomosp. F10 str. ZF-129]OEE96186.1 hypothetical protein A1QM_17210 [Vibrio genomosp. F10 str. 9ZC157]